MGYGDGQKGYSCFKPINHKLYVSQNVHFLERIHFFSISPSSPSVSRFDLILTGPFVGNIDSDHADIDRDPHEDTTTPPTSPIPSPPPRIDDPPLPPPDRILKSTRLPNFSYYAYSQSFTSFLTSINNISESSPYKEVVLDPLWHDL